MRVPRVPTLPLLVAVVAMSCQDAAPTSPATGSARVAGAARAHRAGHSSRGAAASVTIPAPNGFASTVLARGSFSDAIDAKLRIKEEHRTTVVHVDDPTQMVMARIAFAPGGALPWHTHPGPALVTVASGELTLVDGDDCSVRRYPAGASFIDPGQGHVHVGLNPTAAETVLFVTYLDVPVGQSPLVVAPAPGC